jgi:hypothetical protein
MDLTITFDEVTTLVAANLPSLEPRPTFERIRTLRRHFERALQRLPCPQSTLHGWKGLVMARELYALLTGLHNPFRIPVDPGAVAIYTRPVVTGQPVDLSPLSRTEQATIDTQFARQKHYFLSLQNIERACFTVLDASINDAFKVSTDPAIRGWHAGMSVRDILDQLSSIYGQPTPAAMEINDTAFRGVYSAADAPEVLFRRIEDCAEIAILGRNPYTDRQLLQNAIRLLLTTGLYVRTFEEWDRLLPAAQTWVTLRTMIQEAFQRRLNATAPTAGHHGYAPALPYHNAFGALATEDDEDDDGEESITESISNNLAALTYQSQMTASTAATTTQRNSQQLANIEANQQATHSTLHQIIAQLNAVTFNASDAGRGHQGFQAQGIQHGRGRGRTPGGGGRGRGFGRGPPQYVGGSFPNFPTTQGRGFPPAAPQGGGFPPGFGGQHGGPARPPAFVPSTFAPQGGMNGGQQGPPQYRGPAGVQGTNQGQQQPFSNVTKRYANWNACYSCGFDVADGHTSMSCPAHLRKATHDIYFNRQNAQQYIDLGHPCSTRNRHKSQFPGM